VSLVVGFHWAADKQLRDAVCDFAGDSRRANPLGGRPLHPRPQTAATTTRTPCASWPAPGSTWSGSPPATAPCNTPAPAEA